MIFHLTNHGFETYHLVSEGTDEFTFPVIEKSAFDAAIKERDEYKDMCRQMKEEIKDTINEFNEDCTVSTLQIRCLESVLRRLQEMKK